MRYKIKTVEKKPIDEIGQQAIPIVEKRNFASYSIFMRLFKEAR